MEMSLLVLIGIAVVYAVLILIVAKLDPQRGTAVGISSQATESNFGLKEGQTIIGVMDKKKTMAFYIGTNVRDEKNYE